MSLCHKFDHISTDKQSYGDEKGACENIFSYGFLEDGVSSAKVMFLALDIPNDDPLRPAKVFVSTAAPGFRIFDKDGSVGWESDYIWLVVINEEDGLDFRIRQTIDGEREIQAFWKELELDDTTKLRDYLQEDPAWDVFQLRAVVLLQNRVEAQMEMIQAMQGLNQELTVRDIPWRLAERLRNLEFDMLQRATLALDSQVNNPSDLCLSHYSLLAALLRSMSHFADFPTRMLEDPCGICLPICGPAVVEPNCKVALDRQLGYSTFRRQLREPMMTYDIN